MENIDLSNYTIKQLERLAADVQQQIGRKREEEKQKILEKMTELAASIGLTPKEILRVTKPKSTRAKPKYQNPNNLKQTWSGKGKRPAWIIELLEGGQSLEELLIAP